MWKKVDESSLPNKTRAHVQSASRIEANITEDFGVCKQITMNGWTQGSNRAETGKAQGYSEPLGYHV